MNNEKLLDYKLVLLLAEYGERRVMDALARRRGNTVPELEEILRELSDEKPRSTHHGRAEKAFTIESILRQYPEKADHLRTLLKKFEGRIFLPELKDVRQFFERRSLPFGSVKSRSETTPRLFRLLATFDVEELAKLRESDEGSNYSSLGIISDQIMRREK